MRIKNFTLLFLMGLFGLFSINAQAQQDATIAPENIRYWIGEGENQVVFIVNWNEPDTALAWGYRFNAESVTVETVMDAISDADPRFSYEGSNGWLNNIFFNDGVLDLSLSGAYWMYNVNGGEANLYNLQTVANNDYIKWGDESCGFLIDPSLYIMGWEKEVAPVYPIAYDATIDPSEILYWIGEGENEVVFAVNFAEPEDACFAWGYRFAGESVTIKEMMLAMAEVDQRLSFNDAPSSWGGYALTDLTFNYGENQYVLQGYNAMYIVNGMSSWYTYDAQTVINGDFVKWGDYTIGTEIAPWTYVWETPVRPVSGYNTVVENTATMSLYPNPATSYTMLEVSEMSNATVTVTDLQGRVLNSFAVAQTNEPIRIETDSYQAGIYFVTISDANSRQTVKLSVK